MLCWIDFTICLSTTVHGDKYVHGLRFVVFCFGYRVAYFSPVIYALLHWNWLYRCQESEPEDKMNISWMKKTPQNPLHNVWGLLLNLDGCFDIFLSYGLSLWSVIPTLFW